MPATDGMKAMAVARRARERGDTSILFWSERGEVCCAQHAPYPGTDTWIWERWRPMTDGEQQEWVRTLGQPPRCEICREDD